MIFYLVKQRLKNYFKSYQEAMNFLSFIDNQTSLQELSSIDKYRSVLSIINALENNSEEEIRLFREEIKRLLPQNLLKIDRFG